ncbi:MAG: cytidine deaminase [Bacilli bacterium]|nr:cytidine deaminase [Bacilli bacterium]
MEFEDLIRIAYANLKPNKLSKYVTVGEVSCALLTDKGNVYTGVNIDAACSVGFCAEHAAISAMINAGETRIMKIVTVSNHNVIYPPCGRCRELISQVDERNFQTEIMMDDKTILRLKDVLPFDWKYH